MAAELTPRRLSARELISTPNSHVINYKAVTVGYAVAAAAVAVAAVAAVAASSGNCSSNSSSVWIAQHSHYSFRGRGLNWRGVEWHGVEWHGGRGVAWRGVRDAEPAPMC